MIVRSRRFLSRASSERAREKDQSWTALCLAALIMEREKLSCSHAEAGDQMDGCPKHRRSTIQASRGSHSAG